MPLIGPACRETLALYRLSSVGGSATDVAWLCLVASVSKWIVTLLAVMRRVIEYQIIRGYCDDLISKRYPNLPHRILCCLVRFVTFIKLSCLEIAHVTSTSSIVGLHNPRGLLPDAITSNCLQLSCRISRVVSSNPMAGYES